MAASANNAERSSAELAPVIPPWLRRTLAGIHRNEFSNLLSVLSLTWAFAHVSAELVPLQRTICFCILCAAVVGIAVVARFARDRSNPLRGLSEDEAQRMMNDTSVVTKSSGPPSVPEQPEPGTKRADDLYDPIGYGWTPDRARVLRVLTEYSEATDADH